MHIAYPYPSKAALESLDESGGTKSKALLVSRLEKVSGLLDSYYSPNGPMGALRLHDLSLGTHRIRQEADHYLRGLVDSTVSFGNEPPNLPVSLNALREAKRSNHSYSQIDSPWWHRELQSDEELFHIVDEAEGNSLII